MSFHLTDADPNLDPCGMSNHSAKSPECEEDVKRGDNNMHSPTSPQLRENPTDDESSANSGGNKVSATDPMVLSMICTHKMHSLRAQIQPKICPMPQCKRWPNPGGSMQEACLPVLQSSAARPVGTFTHPILLETDDGDGTGAGAGDDCGGKNMRELSEDAARAGVTSRRILSQLTPGSEALQGCVTTLA